MEAPKESKQENVALSAYHAEEQKKGQISHALRAVTLSPLTGAVIMLDQVSKYTQEQEVDADH